MVGRNINILSKQEYDDIQIEYGKIIYASIIPKGDDAIYHAFNVFNIQKVFERKRGKFTNRFIFEDDRK